jgi:hypothetical protein
MLQGKKNEQVTRDTVNAAIMQAAELHKETIDNLIVSITDNVHNKPNIAAFIASVEIIARLISAAPENIRSSLAHTAANILMEIGDEKPVQEEA